MHLKEDVLYLMILGEKGKLQAHQRSRTLGLPISTSDALPDKLSRLISPQ